MGRMKIEKGKRKKSKKPKDVNKPKRATSAYFFYMASCRDQAKKAGKNVSKVAEFTKECSEKWKNLSSSQRKPFDEKAAKDKARYEKEMAEYKGKSSGDPDKPKRPPTSYFLFLADFRKNYVPKDKSEQNSAHKIILKEAGEKWRDMTLEEKKHYVKRSEEEVKKYKAAIADYKKKSSGAVTEWIDKFLSLSFLTSSFFFFFFFFSFL
ncbi:HMGB3 [Acanthosepion pharaonis]|uniref:HMGB3 n=1 Tax=Acanthosepion pharaonis TaxID=158019 RepID=A0A812ANF6_ACAPH|nr:HMGB3 [Sepia pharaonis]